MSRTSREIDELVDLSVGVARDVTSVPSQVGFSVRRLTGMMGNSCLSAQWSSRGLEDAEVAEVLVAEQILFSCRISSGW